MRRRFVSLLAILGLLVHVAAWAHHAAMRGVAMPAAGSIATSHNDASNAPSLEAQFARALLVICHAAGSDDPAKSLDGSKAPAGGKLKPCPLCSLAQIAQALPPVTFDAVIAPVGISAATSFLHADQRREYQRKIRPPSRAPPASLA